MRFCYSFLPHCYILTDHFLLPLCHFCWVLTAIALHSISACYYYWCAIPHLLVLPLTRAFYRKRTLHFIDYRHVLHLPDSFYSSRISFDYSKNSGVFIVTCSVNCWTHFGISRIGIVTTSFYIVIFTTLFWYILHIRFLTILYVLRATANQEVFKLLYTAMRALSAFLTGDRYIAFHCFILPFVLQTDFCCPILPVSTL